MASKIVLNGRVIHLYNYEEELVNGLYKVSVDFNVTSEDYHDITTLLYSGTFDVKVPEKDLTFIGTIHNYSTSITNLYVKNQIGQFKLTLLEVSHKEKD
ncbi:DUF3219 family protein [Sporosarcina sp. G11-34]|uniref:DUF3219 family protein n=1 Tax=Sporosarcina sp. G11-34 TaxID=2849605 RepID=UPI0022A9F4B4|nr:DUF3219 family protein [Sporosarcina sp. G11-34]MCZ2258283.1 YkvR family protein [Sporosarcina sp. G11-34]